MEFVSEQEILKVQEKVAQVDFSMQVNKMIEYTNWIKIMLWRACNNIKIF
ncbi:hypothetical protein FOG23_05475 [Helicobacter pylori]|nr:hypothetical protein FOG23_05475 [Helicobacter pylori]